ncbi:MAG: hypothetical protein RLZZ402_736 [Bacteroidota bacterium]|jgi:hypothetical protein
MLRFCSIIGISTIFFTGCDRSAIHDEWVKLNYYHINSTSATITLDKYELGSKFSSGPIKPGDTLMVEMLIEGNLPKPADWNLLPTWAYSYLDSLIIRYNDTLCYTLYKGDVGNYLFQIENYSIVKERKTTLGLTIVLPDSLFTNKLGLCK